MGTIRNRYTPLQSQTETQLHISFHCYRLSLKGQLLGFMVVVGLSPGLMVCFFKNASNRAQCFVAAEMFYKKQTFAHRSLPLLNVYSFFIFLCVSPPPSVYFLPRSRAANVLLGCNSRSDCM